MHGSHAGGRRNQLSKALGLRLGARKGNLKTLGDGLMRQLAGVCGWIRDCFKPDFDSSAIPAAGEPVDHEFRWTGTRWTPMSQSQWGNMASLHGSTGFRPLGFGTHRHLS